MHFFHCERNFDKLLITNNSLKKTKFCWVMILNKVKRNSFGHQYFYSILKWYSNILVLLQYSVFLYLSLSEISIDLPSNPKNWYRVKILQNFFFLKALVIFEDWLRWIIGQSKFWFNPIDDNMPLSQRILNLFFILIKILE